MRPTDQTDLLCRVTLRFAPDGAAVQGAWSSLEVARREFRERIGLYGTPASTAAIRLWGGFTDGRECTVGEWPKRFA
ncbi:hypothetical protein ABZ829_12020 [Streptomyces xanthochromogenes]|uniref:hypothetical protein n=1 Tax=Streptomyces xanthochromogenes TaxID=67384 RepID=UPI003425BB8B